MNELFSNITCDWFAMRFGKPTDVQMQAWPTIASGKNALVIAPTGSGKTLAAFLYAIDRMMTGQRNAAQTEAQSSTPSAASTNTANSANSAPAVAASSARRAPNRASRRAKKRKGVRVLYISPLKALGVDVAKNLDTPLDGIRALAAQEGLTIPEITVATRSGDTTAQQRRAIVSRPPDILVTTPESLYLMLTSKARETLKTVELVIVDEVHALAGTKRGAHLALSLERLDDLAGHAIQRVGLSATVEPPEVAANFLGGSHHVDIVRSAGLPAVDLQIIDPNRRMSDGGSSMWPPNDIAATELDESANERNTSERSETARSTTTHQSTQTSSRTGKRSHQPTHISGVTGAMVRLAQRNGTLPANTSSLTSTPSTRPNALNITNLANPTTDMTGGSSAPNGSVWPAVQRSILDEILKHRTTLVFVNSRGLAERLTAQINDLYHQTHGNLRQSQANANVGNDSDAASYEPSETLNANSNLTQQSIPSGDLLDDTMTRVLQAHRNGTSTTATSSAMQQLIDSAEPAHYRSSLGSPSMLVGEQHQDDAIAMAHHGSVSKDRRKQIEDQLKHGQLRCVVATSSLELGIDMGSVDLVIQVAAPLSISSGLQRVGRADHRVGGVSHALLYPLTREQIISVATSVECMKAGALEPLTMPMNALDVLAQQTVAQTAISEVLNADEWFNTVRRAAPFSTLDREMFDMTVGMLSGDYASEEFSAFRPPLAYDDTTHTLTPRPGASRLAVMSGGTIPDRGLYTVVLPEADAGKGPRRVGELDEEMVYESRVGDVITLGTNTWQIKEITRDRVVVTPAQGRSARLPFWHGEGNGTDYRFALAQGRFIEDAVAGLITATAHEQQDTDERNDADEASQPTSSTSTSSIALTEASSQPTFTQPILERLHADGLDEHGVNNLATLLAEQRVSTHVVPSARHVVIERSRDEEGGWRIVIHASFGKRVNEPWSMAIDYRLRTRYGFTGHVFAGDTGIVIQTPDGDGMLDLMSVIQFNDLDELNRILRTQVGETVLFAARFRECAARSLFLPRTEPGKRVPLWQQRLRSSQLLTTAREYKNFPLLLETARECLQDVYDVPALTEVMNGINAGIITLSDTQTDVPSPFAQQLLFGFIGSVMYQQDMPQAERSAQLLSIDPDVLAKLLNTGETHVELDTTIIDEISEQLASRTFWNDLDESDINGRIARFAHTHGPFTVDMASAQLNIDAETIVRTLDAMQDKGLVITGQFDPRLPERVTQWLDKDVFVRLRNRTLAQARKAIKPVTPATYQQYVFGLQHVSTPQVTMGYGYAGSPTQAAGDMRLDGIDGLLRVIEQLEGIALPVLTWEESVFPARIRNYSPAMLDELIMNGSVKWLANTDATVSFYPADSVWFASATTNAYQTWLQRHQSAATAVTSVPSASSAASAVSARAKRSRGSSAASVRTAKATEKTALAENELLLERLVVHALVSGGAWNAQQLVSRVHHAWMEQAEPIVNPVTGEVVPPPWSDAMFERVLWSLVEQGVATNSSFAPMRAKQLHEQPIKTSNSRRRMRLNTSAMRASMAAARVPHTSTSATMSGLWSSAIPADILAANASDGTMHADDATDITDATEVASLSSVIAASVSIEETRLAQVEALLDRYGLVAAPLVDSERIGGGFSALYPVLRHMEDNGLLARGMFVEGFGAAQFMTRDNVNSLRTLHADATDTCTAIDAIDPALLSGTAIAWPEPADIQTFNDRSSSSTTSQLTDTRESLQSRSASTAMKPVRRAGTIAVLRHGEPLLYAAIRGGHLVAFTDVRTLLEPAFQSLTERLQAARAAASMTSSGAGSSSFGTSSITFTDINGTSLLTMHAITRMMQQAGFAVSPQGMRLYR